MDFTLNAELVNTLLSVVIPIVTGLLTKVSTPGHVKQVITIVLNAVVALLTTGVASDGSVFLDASTVRNFVVGIVISVAMYANVYKPAGLTSSKTDGKLAPTRGLL